jgi:hypothetical protein
MNWVASGDPLAAATTVENRTESLIADLVA